MKNKLLCNTILGIVLVSILGTLFHFVYEWSGQNRIVGLFMPVNESTWEHMKLAFFPMLLFFWSENFFPYGLSFSKAGFRAATALTATLLIPVIFYTYTGILGTHYGVLDIATYYVCVIAAFALRYRYISHGKEQGYPLLWTTSVILMCACFFLFTYHPLQLGIFISP